jgi:DNA-binding CsgD family transcriptional regulator
MVSLTTFSHLVSLIYAAVLSPTGWDEAMTAIHASLSDVNGQAGIVRSTALTFAAGGNRQVVGELLIEAEQPYNDYYGRIDHVLEEVERGPVGVVRTGDELIAPRAATEFHNDWIRPNNLEEGLFVKLTAGASRATFVVAGSQGSDAFDTADRVGLVRELVPHLQQALSTQRHLITVTERAQSFGEAVDRLSRGIVIITENLEVIDANAAATAILSERDGLHVTNGNLGASMPFDEHNLRGLVYQSFRTDDAKRGGAMVCQRISGRRGYALHILPLQTSTAESRSKPVAMVLVIDPTRETIPLEQMLRQLYRLTKGEASVAQLVLYGEGVQAISDRLSLSNATVRTHLRSIFTKTGTHRQAELVRLLSTVTP